MIHSSSNDQEILDRTTQDATEHEVSYSIVLPSGKTLTSDPAPLKASTVIAWCNAVRDRLASDEEHARKADVSRTEPPAPEKEAPPPDGAPGEFSPEEYVTMQMEAASREYDRARATAEAAVAAAKKARDKADEWALIHAAYKAHKKDDS